MAKRFIITKDLVVLEFEAVNEWGHARHKHNFFELTFVLEGSGKHVLNESVIDYNKGDLFFLTPNDEHEFIIDEASKFGIIKFTEQIFTEKATFLSNTYWRRNIDAVIFHSNIIAESIIHYDADRDQLFMLYELIKNELNNELVYSRNVLTELFGALLIIMARNLKSTIKAKGVEGITDKEKIDSILTYIRQNVLNKEAVKIKVLADQFNMSENYISVYIKKHIGISVQQYLIECKLKMAESLLKQTNLSINQIAEKSGFTDASHFNRMFNKYMGKNPSAAR